MRIRLEAANAAIGVAEGVIVAPDGHFDVTLRAPAAELRPGLINPHDHLHRNHYGRLGQPPYRNAYEWGRDIHARDADRIARGRSLPRRQALLAGAWKNLRAGVTSVVHHDPWEPAFDADFPLRVVRVACAHSLGFEPALAAPAPGPFAIHLAEGTDAGSADEVRALDARGLVNDALLAVHVVGADADGIGRLRRAGAAIIWCPSSNEFLLGATAPRALLADGVDVLVGSDSLLTAAGDLLDELRVARAYGYLDDDRLDAAVGRTAARRLCIAAPSLAPGARADVVLLRRPLLECSASDVLAVVADGALRVLAPELLPALGAYARRGTPWVVNDEVRWLFGYDPGVPGGFVEGTAQRTAPVTRRRSRTW